MSLWKDKITTDNDSTYPLVSDVPKYRTSVHRPPDYVHVQNALAMWGQLREEFSATDFVKSRSWWSVCQNSTLHERWSCKWIELTQTRGIYQTKGERSKLPELLKIKNLKDRKWSSLVIFQILLLQIPSPSFRWCSMHTLPQKENPLSFR